MSPPPPERDDAALERVEVLMMKAVDGVLTSGERAELDALLADDPARRAELADHLAIKEDTDMLRQRIVADATIEPIRPSLASLATSGLGIGLMLLAAAVLGGWAMVQILADSALPVWLRATIGAGIAGALILLIQVAVRRARGISSDPYREIDL